MQANTLEDLSLKFNNELELVYKNFNKSFSRPSQIDDISKYQVFSGGKRIRPLIIFTISNLFSDTINPLTINFATAIELLHNATLIHDDIIDESKFRRSQATVREKYGDSKAILSGDYLFAYAFDYVIELPKELIIETQKTALQLIKGEFNELDIDFKHIGPNDSLNIMLDKTASLFSLCTKGAYLLSNQEYDSRQYEMFSQLGTYIGLCFQIMDDILDVKATKEISGKKQCTDFIEKKPSIIVSLWLNKKTKSLEKYILCDNVENNILTDIKIELEENNIINEANNYFNTYFNKASDILSELHKNFSYKNANNILILLNYLQYLQNIIKN